MAYRRGDPDATARDLVVALRKADEMGMRPIEYLAQRRGHESPAGES